jgi:hypothetical protein
MRSRIVLIILAFALSAFLLAGCTDRTKDNPTRPGYTDQGIGTWINSWTFYSLFFSTSFDPGYIVSRTYTPPGYNWQGGGGRPYPVLYMLSPFRGDERYYFEHGLARTADRLISEGKIQPMIIVSIDGRSQLGASFYTDSHQQGKYFSSFFVEESYYVDPFVDPDGSATGHPGAYRGPHTVINLPKIPRYEDWYNIVSSPKARGVSGVGVGGYGAFAMALKTGMFSSVSAVNAPLDFDGDDNGGFKTLLAEFTPAEWIYGDTLSVDSIDTIPDYPNPGDTIFDTSWVIVDSVYWVDTSLANPELSLLVSASAAFSPHYTASDIDSVYVRESDNVQTWAFTPTDSLTDDFSSYLPAHQIHYAYDNQRNLNTSIWNVWMQNNIEDMYNANVGGHAADFDNVAKLLIKSEDAKYYYTEQMDAFIQFLVDKNDPNFDTLTFQGNELLVGTADHFLYDLMEDILIFHSNEFGGVLDVAAGATQVSQSPVNQVDDSTVISATFAHTAAPSVSVFTATFKIRGPNDDSPELILVNNQPSGSGGLTIAYNGGGSYTASYVYNPDNTQTPGLYDLYFEVTDGTLITIDGFDNNLDGLEIEVSTK